MTADSEARRGARLWTTVAAGISLPAVVILCITLWRAPYPFSDSIGHFEDATSRPAASFLIPTSSYYRPLFYLSLSALWHSASSIDAALTAIRFLHIVPIALLVALLLLHARPRNGVDAAAATLAVAALLGASGFRDNLELPLSYTIVGMPALLAVWLLLERDHRRWHGLVILLLTMIAIGFKEQGLVIVPLIVAAWWLGAPGATRGMAAAATLGAIAYVALRLYTHDERLPLFEQDVGFGFSRLSTTDAEARFGAFPFGIFVYSGASTIANVLFAEPTDGIFRILGAWRSGAFEAWHATHLVSSVGLTLLIVWWGVSALRRHENGRWSAEARLFLLMLVVLLATGALSFNYSRDRLGGMAIPLYAIAAFHAVRAMVWRRSFRSPGGAWLPAVAAAMVLLFLAAAWQLRVVHTIESTRQRAVNTEREWAIHFHERRAEIAHRTTYRRIFDGMLYQGTTPDAIGRTRFPRWLVQMIGEY